MLKKKYLLKDKEIIATLFKKGEKATKSPITAIVMTHDSNGAVFTVLKKQISRAVDRNKIKRQMKAIYFKNKELFIKQKPSKNMAFIYFGKELIPFSNLEKTMIELIKRLNKNEAN